MNIELAKRGSLVKNFSGWLLLETSLYMYEMSDQNYFQTMNDFAKATSLTSSILSQPSKYRNVEASGSKDLQALERLTAYLINMETQSTKRVKINGGMDTAMNA
jgi:hypothetical protein